MKKTSNYEYYFKGQPTGIIRDKRTIALSEYNKHTGSKLRPLEFLGNGTWKELIKNKLC